MGAAGHQRVAIHAAQVGPLALGQAEGGGGRDRIGDEALDEGRVGLERVEAAVERVGLGRREAVVGALAHGVGSGHSTTALPWCQEGS
jgi:hypothetical protein